MAYTGRQRIVGIVLIVAMILLIAFSVTEIAFCLAFLMAVSSPAALPSSPSILSTSSSSPRSTVSSRVSSANLNSWWQVTQTRSLFPKSYISLSSARARWAMVTSRLWALVRALASVRIIIGALLLLVPLLRDHELCSLPSPT